MIGSLTLLAGFAAIGTTAFAPISGRMVVFIVLALAAPIAAAFDLVPAAARFRTTKRGDLAMVGPVLRGIGWLGVSCVAVMSFNAPMPQAPAVAAFLTVLAGQVLGFLFGSRNPTTGGSPPVHSR